MIAYQYGNFLAASLAARGHEVEDIYREAVKWADLGFAGLL